MRRVFRQEGLTSAVSIVCVCVCAWCVVCGAWCVVCGMWCVVCVCVVVCICVRVLYNCFVFACALVYVSFYVSSYLFVGLFDSLLL